MELLPVDPVRPDPTAIARAAECLRNGGLVAFPTETVYGIGAHALDRTAVARVFAAKQRPAHDPLIVHVADAASAAPLVTRMPDSAAVLAARFWPGPLTLVLHRSERVPDEVTAGLATVAIRVPAHPVARALLLLAQLPIAAPSANLFSRPSPTRAVHVAADLGDRIDLILDAGPATIGVESTVLDLSGPVPTVLRPGAVAIEALRAVLPSVSVADDGTAASEGPQISPGLLSKHYSPRAAMRLYEGAPDTALTALVRDASLEMERNISVGVLVQTEDLARVHTLPHAQLYDLGSCREPEVIAARLYTGLRDLDAAGVNVILAHVDGRNDGLWPAIRDRLRRAAAGTIVTG
jgi:L-threonylcarbamoyladenylate synthase